MQRPDFLLTLVLLGPACKAADNGSPPPSAEVSVRLVRSSDLVTRIDTIELGGQDSVPLVRLSGVFWADGGRILIADVSEANAKLYGQDGRLLLVLGSKGSGPGQFQRPRYPFIDSHGRLIVAEETGLVSYFDSSGTFVKRVSVGGGMGISSFSVRENGNIIVTGWPAEPGVLGEFDSLGILKRRFIPRRSPPVTDDAKNPAWTSVTQYWHVPLGDTVVVSATVSDSLWYVALPSGTVTSTRLRVPGYTAPHLPTDKPDPRSRDPFRWIREQYTAVGPVGSGIPGKPLGLSFVKGILHYGDPAVFVLRTPRGSWVGTSDLPPILALHEKEALGLIVSDSTRVRVGYIQFRFD
jgi:hypothetical protein